MKFTGIVAALSVAGSVSAAVIPQLPLANALNKLDSVLSNVDGLLGQTLTCVTGNVDLGQVKSELVAIKSQLSSIAPVSAKRGIESTAAGTVGGALQTVNQVVPVSGVEAEAAGVAGTVSGEASNVAAGLGVSGLNVAGVKRGIESTAAGAVGGAVQTVNQVVPVSGVEAEAAGVAGTVSGEVSNVAGGLGVSGLNVAGVKRSASAAANVDTQALAQSLVQQIQSGTLDAAGLNNVLGVLATL